MTDLKSFEQNEDEKKFFLKSLEEAMKGEPTPIKPIVTKPEAEKQVRDSVAVIKKMYTDLWEDNIPDTIQEGISYMRERIKKKNYTITDMIESNKTINDNSIEYNMIMCLLAEKIKSNHGDPSVFETELYPFFESKTLLPHLIYLFKHSHGAKIKVKDLDTIILNSCNWIYLREFEIGNLIVDCDSGEIQSIGSEMKGGKIIVTEKIRLSKLSYDNKLGHEMNGGELIYNGNLADFEIGTAMKKGEITINGNVDGRSDIGNYMGGGRILISGNISLSEQNIYGIGHEMEGGSIDIKGSVSSETYVITDLGDKMSGGIIHVKNGVYGQIAVGDYMTGNSNIEIDSDCKAAKIGYNMEGGTIKIRGSASGDLGCYMENGLIDIKGNWDGAMLGFKKKGGNIYIRGRRITWLERFKHNM